MADKEFLNELYRESRITPSERAKIEYQRKKGEVFDTVIKTINEEDIKYLCLNASRNNISSIFITLGNKKYDYDSSSIDYIFDFDKNAISRLGITVDKNKGRFDARDFRACDIQAINSKEIDSYVKYGEPYCFNIERAKILANRLDNCIKEIGFTDYRIVIMKIPFCTIYESLLGKKKFKKTGEYDYAVFAEINW